MKRSSIDVLLSLSLFYYFIKHLFIFLMYLHEFCPFLIKMDHWKAKIPIIVFQLIKRKRLDSGRAFHFRH